MTAINNTPLVSIIIPFRNEEKHIADCINSVLNNDYPIDKTEILLIDGLSSDSSLSIINAFISQYPFIKLITNEKKIFPAAVNLGYNNSKGDFIIILGAHAVYEKNYFSGCVNASLNNNADNTGGILNTVGLNTSFIGKAITYCLSSSFGVGNATFRTGSNEVKEVDTVFGGCYKRIVFEKIGLFNEKLVSSSDMDFNVRLKKQGGKIILDPSIKATYYTRTSFAKFIRNNYRNGYWAIYPIKFLDYIPVKLRHFIPLIFLSGLIGGIILSFFIYLLSGALLLYFLAAFVFSSKFLSKGIHYFLFLPLLFFLLHINYGIGSFIALIKVAFSKIFRNG
jgi:glycosyltransferase involved in cell wall biosynthesis